MAKSLDELRLEKPAKPVAKSQEPQTIFEHILSWIKTLGGAIIIVMFINGAIIASFVVPTGSMEKTVLTGDFLFVNKFIFGPSTPQIVPFFNIPLPFFKFPGWRQPEKNDVIVFIFPGLIDEAASSEFQYYLKRCVATAGDTLVVRDKIVYVNGQAVPLAADAFFDEHIPMSNDDARRTFPKGRGFTRDNYGPLVIPKKGDVVAITPQNLREWDTFIRREGHRIAVTGSNILIDGVPATSYTVERDYCFGMGDNRNNSLDSRYWGFIPMESVVGTPMIAYWSWETNLNSIFDKFKTIRFSRMGRIIR